MKKGAQKTRKMNPILLKNVLKRLQSVSEKLKKMSKNFLDGSVNLKDVSRVSPEDSEHLPSKNPIGGNDSLFRECNDLLLPNL